MQIFWEPWSDLAYGNIVGKTKKAMKWNLSSKGLAQARL